MIQKVLIMKCDEYDPVRISGIIKEGMEELGAKPRGKTMLKPNCVVAHPEYFPYAFTRPEFVEGVLIAAKEKGGAVTELSVGERCGITLPTRWAFGHAGYKEVMKRQGARPYYFDEVRQVPVSLKAEGRLRDLIFVPKPVVECDFLINLPKFKAHPWTKLTLSLKNYIGIQDDRHRLVDHNCFLEHKIADLQEVIQPGFIAIDAIVAGQKMMLTPTPANMGAIVMGTNQCAVDTVGCHMVNMDPSDLIHLKLSAERGLGPTDLEKIEVSGDFPLEEVQHRNKDFEFCLEHVDRYFEDSPGLTCHVGSFPESHSADYCWGGCPGALQEAIHIARQYTPGLEGSMKKVRYVVGNYNGPLDLDDDERVLFVGDCCKWQGNINGERVKIEGDYKTTALVSALNTESNDMIKKILGSILHCIWNRNSRYIYAKGCPVSVGQHVNYLSSLGKFPNANFDRKNFVPVNVAYWQMRALRFWNHLFG